MGYENFKRNNIDPADHMFVKQDVLPFLVNARKKSIEYNIVICDPPTFFNSTSTDDGRSQTHSKKQVAMSCNKNYDALVIHAAKIVKCGGYLVLFCNSKSLRKKKWLEMIRRGLEAVSSHEHVDVSTDAAHKETHHFEFIQDLHASADFREESEEPDLKGILFRKVDNKKRNEV